MIINPFKDNIFPLSPEEGLSEFVSRDEDEDEKATPRDILDLRTTESSGLGTSESSDLRTSESSAEGTPRDMSDRLYKIITENHKIRKKKRLKEYFGYNSLSDMQKELSTTKGTPVNEIVVDTVRDDLDKEAFKTHLSKYTTEYPHEAVYSVKKILDFNEQYQERRGLKILTPQQMLNRLPICLIQLKAGNNSQKLKNEIRQLLHSLYR